MTVAAQVLISAQTGAKTSDPVQRNDADGKCTIVAIGLAGAETVGVQIAGADGTFANILASPAVQLTASINTIVLPGPGIYKFVKSATTAAVGVALYSV